MIQHLQGEQLWTEETIELGDPMSSDPSFYVSGNGLTMNLTKIDTSQVNNKKVGDYTARAVSPVNTFEYRISVRDTTPPELYIGNGQRQVLRTGVEYDPKIIGASASDLSGIAFIKYYIDGEETDKLFFDKASRPEVTVRATDGNMNMAEKTVKLVVDTPPRFYGVHDQYILMGRSAKDLDPVFAADDADGGITSRIITDFSGVDFSNIGDYRIKYEVKDSYGLEARAESTVHVVSSYQRVKEHADDCILTASDLAYAVEEGFFKSEPFESPDRKRVIDKCKVSLVNLLVENDDNISSGSAFIYEVDPDYIYMISVYHVTSELERKPVTITFYDGSSMRAAIRSVRLSAGNEAAMFKVPVKSVPYHVLVRLKEVAREDDIYDHVKAGTPLIEYSVMWRGGEKPQMIKDVKVISFELSYIQKKYVDGDSYFTATRESVSGMSGTAVFDYRGVLSGICSKTIYPLDDEEKRFRNGSDLLLKVDGLDDFSERKDSL